MEPQQCVEYALHIATAREDMGEIQRHLDATRREIVDAQRAIEDLTIEACTLRVRMKELELDEELVKKSEDEAIMDKIVSQKRLVEIGGIDSAVRALQKALDDARHELQATRGPCSLFLSFSLSLCLSLCVYQRRKMEPHQYSYFTTCYCATHCTDETQNVIAEEKKMQTEFVNLSAILQRTRANSVKLQEEYSSVMREKRESDAKLKQLCLFLQTDAAQSPMGGNAATPPHATALSPASVGSSSSTATSPSGPSSPRVVLHLGSDLEVTVPEVQF